MQRVASLALVSCGVLLGLLLPRPWTEVERAEAQGGQVEYVCFDLGVSPDMMSTIRLYNPNRTAVSVRYARTTAGGVSEGEEAISDVLPGRTGGVSFALSSFVGDPYVSVKIRASQNLLIGGEVVHGTGLVTEYQRPLTCARLGG